MSWRAHKTTSDRKLITLQEWADFCGLSRQAIAGYIRAYGKQGGAYDPKDIYSVLSFFLYLLKTAKMSVQKTYLDTHE